MNSLIRLLYALLVAASVVTFVGLGVYSFYLPPKAPAYPDYSYTGSGDAAYERTSKEYDKKYKAYEKKQKNYQRNVTYAVLPLAVFFVLTGLYLFRRSDVIGEGVALGGIATSIYAIITASIAEARILRFLAVTLLLVGVLLLTYRRFYSRESKKT